MKKINLVVLIGVILVVVAGAGYFAVKKDSPKDNSSQEIMVTKNACDILTEETVKTILGESTSKADASNNADASSDDIALSQCVYSESLDQGNISPQTQQSASLLVRSPKTEAGRQANTAVFVSGAMPQGADEVDGYGEKAFWNTDFGQLNILKEGNWYILEFGVSVPTNRNLEDTKKFADVVINKF